MSGLSCKKVLGSISLSCNKAFLMVCVGDHWPRAITIEHLWYIPPIQISKTSSGTKDLNISELNQQLCTYIQQARSQGGFEGVRTNPLCSLTKFIFNETAAVQGTGTIIHPCSGIATDGIQAIMQLLQGVVTYTSPVEAFVTGIKNSDWWKPSLIAWSLRSEALDRLIYYESAVVIMTFIDHTPHK